MNRLATLARDAVDLGVEAELATALHAEGLVHRWTARNARKRARLALAALARTATAWRVRRWTFGGAA